MCNQVIIDKVGSYTDFDGRFAATRNAWNFAY
jgi:hypothetical protein